MATIGQAHNLVEWGKRIGPDGKIARIIEMLVRENSMLDDMLWMEANGTTTHESTQRTGIPIPTFRLINQGVAPTKSETAQIKDAIAMLEDRSEIDIALIKRNAHNEAYRLTESIAHMQGMNDTTQTTLIYGSANTPSEYVGFFERYNDLSAESGENILDGGGTSTDNTSILLAGWGDQASHGIFPKGSQAGLNHRDLGEEDSFDSQNRRFRAMHDIYEWNQGLTVQNWQKNARIANIDVSDLIAQTGTQALTATTSIIKLMSQATDRIIKPSTVKQAFYCNRTIASHLKLIAMEKTTNVLAIEPGLNQFGESIHTLRFLGIPIRIVDAIINTEAQVV